MSVVPRCFILDSAAVSACSVALALGTEECSVQPSLLGRGLQLRPASSPFRLAGPTGDVTATGMNGNARCDQEVICSDAPDWRTVSRVASSIPRRKLGNPARWRRWPSAAGGAESCQEYDIGPADRRRSRMTNGTGS